MLNSRIEQEIRNELRNYPLERHNVDTLLMLCSADKDLLNSRFKQVLQEADSLWVTLNDKGKDEIHTRLNSCFNAYGVVSEVKAEENFANDPTFVVTVEEKLRIKSLCGEMRTVINLSVSIPADHKIRLLKRVSAIELELHKIRGRFDVILGGIVDVGEVAGKFGTDIKPLVDRMREIMGIAWGRSEDYAALPAPDELKRLPAPSPEED